MKVRNKIMHYAVLFLLLPTTLYTLSYVGYNWKNKNRKAAAGLIIMLAASVALPVIIVLAG